MSILNRLKKADSGDGKRLFGIIAGPRLGGKTTLAGTLPGRTYLLQAAVRESGSGSAKAKAAELGNELWVENFTSVADLLEKIAELKTDKDFDNVVVDGVSAITEMKLDEPEIQKLAKKDNWGAYRELADATKMVILALKELTYPDRVAKAKSTFLTCALNIKQDAAGNIVDVSLEVKGNATVSSITKYGEAVLTVLPSTVGEDGVETGNRLITKSTDCWPARIDGLLSDQNPGLIVPADLSKVLELAGVE